MKKALVLAAVSEAATGLALLIVLSLVGMLTYSAAVTLYLAYVGLVEGSSGILLWPAVVLHVVVTALLARASISGKETRT